jgi:hypothetical protein
MADDPLTQAGLVSYLESSSRVVVSRGGEMPVPSRPALLMSEKVLALTGTAREMADRFVFVLARSRVKKWWRLR